MSRTLRCDQLNVLKELFEGRIEVHILKSAVGYHKQAFIILAFTLYWVQLWGVG